MRQGEKGTRRATNKTDTKKGLLHFMPIEFCGKWVGYNDRRRDVGVGGGARRGGVGGGARRGGVGRASRKGRGRGEEEGHLSVGFGRLGLSGIRMCSLKEVERDGGPLALLILLSCLNLRKERRNKGSRGSASITFMLRYTCV